MFASNQKCMRTSQNICAYQNIRFQSKYIGTSWNICTYQKYLLPCKIFAPSKHSLTSKIFVPYLKYLRIYKIYAPHQECSRHIIYDSNKAAVQIFAPYERCMRPENRSPNSYYLGSAESPTSDSFSVWLKSSRSGDVASPPCSPQVGSALRPPNLYGRRLAVLYRLLHRQDLPTYSRLVQMFAAANISTFFLGKIKNLTRLISVLSLHFKFVHNHKSCPNSAVTLLSL